jgi:hypothetical protein
MLPSAVLTHLNAGVRAEADPPPVFLTTASIILGRKIIGRNKSELRSIRL